MIEDKDVITGLEVYMLSAVGLNRNMETVDWLDNSVGMN